MLCCLDQCRKRVTAAIIVLLMVIVIALIIAVIVLNVKIEHGGSSVKHILFSKLVKQLIKKRKHG